MIEYVSNDQTAVFLTCYFRMLNTLLTKKTVTWAEIDVEMMILLKESSSTQDMIIRFKIKFLEQFSKSFVETEFILFYTEISELKQNKNEFLLIYYKWVVIMMKKMSIRDWVRSVMLEQFTFMSNFLNNFESVMLNIVTE